MDEIEKGIEKEIEEKIEKEVINERERVLTVKDWLKIFVVCMIPILNIIMSIKWIVSEKTNLNLKNYLIAGLIIMLVISVIYSSILFCVFGMYWLTMY